MIHDSLRGFVAGPQLAGVIAVARVAVGTIVGGTRTESKEGLTRGVIEELVRHSLESRALIRSYLAVGRDVDAGDRARSQQFTQFGGLQRSQCQARRRQVVRRMYVAPHPQ